MEQAREIGKRDKRNPGHCWQDNELYDVFQPVIGGLAAHVFAVMTRWCFGHEVRIGLRELAEEACVSRSTVHRATLAMQVLGMVRIREGRGRGSAAYELLDLKDAARALGAQEDRRRASYVLNSSQVLALQQKVSTALACVSMRDTKETCAKPACVSVGDAKPCENPLLVSQVVSQKPGVCVPNSGAPSIKQRHKDIKTKPTPVSPPASGTGSGARELSCREGKPLTVQLDAATEKLCRECDLADERPRRKIAKAIAQYSAKERMSPDEAATAMVQAWREYCVAMPKLRFRWGPVRFITHGHWRNPDGWPWACDDGGDSMRMARDARIGMVR